MQSIKAILRWVVGVVAAAVVTLALFLVLPLMQAIGEKQEDDVVLQEINTIQDDAPPDVKEDEPPPDEPEEVEKPPEVDLDQPLMADINQLENLLGGPGGISIPGLDPTINIDGFADAGGDLDDVFDLGALDEKPRVLFQASPKMTSAMRNKTPATVFVIFIVDERGRVQKPTVQSSSDPSFDQAALSAVKQWRFEPGTSKGKPVETRVRQKITFPKE